MKDLSELFRTNLTVVVAFQLTMSLSQCLWTQLNVVHINGSGIGLPP